MNKSKGSDLATQIRVLETRRAGLIQQRLITEKKMAGLRERQAAKEEREREREREREKGVERRGLRKYGD